MSYFSKALHFFTSTVSSIRLMDILDVLIVAALFYFVISLIRKTKTNRVFQGILIVLVVLWISGELQLYTINFILRNLVQIGMLALVVLFQPELRRFLEKLGTGTSVWAAWRGSAMQQEDAAISQIVMACSEMSESKTGALIVFERDNKLDDQIRTGTVIDGIISSELLKNIFYDKSPLHDGAVIIRDGRIQAAACMLPLTNNPNISRELGMRHRAAIGMSEASDGLAIIVSEETGAISVAIDGMLKRHLTRETFEKLLRQELLTAETEDVGTGKLQMLLRRIGENVKK